MQSSALRKTNYSNSVNYTTHPMVSDGKNPTVESWGASSMANPKQTPTEKAPKTITFLYSRPLPPGKKATYLRVCANYCLQKADPFRICWTVGGSLIEYEGETYTTNADITTAKNTKFLGINLKDFYLGTPMQHPEYMLVQAIMITDKTIQEYNFKNYLTAILFLLK